MKHGTKHESVMEVGNFAKKLSESGMIELQERPEFRIEFCPGCSNF